MHPSSAALDPRNQFRHMPVAFLSVLLILLCSVLLSVLSMNPRRGDSRGVIPVGTTSGSCCGRGPMVRLRIDDRGQITFDEQRISADELPYYAAALGAQDDGATVVVSATAGTQLTRVVNVFKTLQRQHVRYMVETAFVEWEAKR